MSLRHLFTGCGVALITPFTPAGEVDYNALALLVERLVSGGIDFICINCTTSESPCLTIDERKTIQRIVVDVTHQRVPIVSGCGGNNTRGVVDELQSWDFTGIDGILSITPYYNKPTQEGLYQHFSALANASPRPIILYNVPSRTGVNMTAGTVLQLAQHSNIIAIKQANGSLADVMTILRDCPDDFSILSGDDGMTMSILSCGGHGAISVLANALPKYMSTLIHSAMSHEVRAAELNLTISPLYDLLFVDGNPAGVKAMMSGMGVVSNSLRLPLVPAREDTMTRMMAVVNTLPEDCL